MSHTVLILFLFALGASVGSFLNVVVWRLPQIEHDPDDRSLLGGFFKTIQGLSNPPSHCPKCGTPLKWYDNLPVIGWLRLGGKCRACGQPISARYPIVEAVCGLLFVFYYVMFFVVQVGPCAPRPAMVPDGALGVFQMVARPLFIRDDWPIYLLYMALIGGLLAASLIDAELFIIPVEIPWVLAAVGIVVHAIIDRPSLPGALNANVGAAALAAGGAVGLILSIALYLRGIIPQSFPDGEPMQDVDEPGAGAGAVQAKDPATGVAVKSRAAGGAAKPSGDVAEPRAAVNDPPPTAAAAAAPVGRAELMVEMRKEMLFLTPPLLLASLWWFAVMKIPAVGRGWESAVAYDWVSGLLGAVLGALVGGMVVWVTRILGTIGFGRLAMGLGDVHLMFGVGAIIGAGGATVAFFLAPFFGIAIAVWMLFTGTRRELPYGPYLSLATAFVLLFGCPILAWLTPGMMGLSLMIRELFGAGGAAGPMG
ncbi:MAG TPA: prepilin peptidase [Tepidisphaeraceae bacterium]|nr:prepilin peptidase [Tepidisphaeraceae bacterium]